MNNEDFKDDIQQRELSKSSMSAKLGWRISLISINRGCGKKMDGIKVINFQMVKILELFMECPNLTLRFLRHVGRPASFLQ